HPDGLGIARDLANVAAVRLPLRVQGLEPPAGPVLAPIRAGEETGAADRHDRPGAPAPDQDVVHVHGIVVDVLPVAHICPVLAPGEAPDDPADLDGPVDLVRVERIDGESEDALGGIGPGTHGDIRKANGHGELAPVLAAVLAPEDLAVLVPSVEHFRVARV